MFLYVCVLSVYYLLFVKKRFTEEKSFNKILRSLFTSKLHVQEEMVIIIKKQQNRSLNTFGSKKKQEKKKKLNRCHL